MVDCSHDRKRLNGKYNTVLTSILMVNIHSVSQIFFSSIPYWMNCVNTKIKWNGI